MLAARVLAWILFTTVSGAPAGAARLASGPQDHPWPPLSGPASLQQGDSGDSAEASPDVAAPDSSGEPSATIETADGASREASTAAGSPTSSGPDLSAPSNEDTRKWTVKLGGHVQSDYVMWASSSPAIVGEANYFEFRRLRLVADGSGYGNLDFRLQLTLEPEAVGESPPGNVTSPDVKDAYLSINEIPGLGRLRFGHFFVPFSLEQVTNDTNNLFLERSLPTQGIFAVDREVGAALYNCSADERVTWTTGLFFDSISESLKERIDDNQGFRISGRLTWLPWYDQGSGGRHLVHTGLGVLHTDDHDDRIRIRARPQVHEGPRLIDSGVLEAGGYTTGNLEAAVVWGRFALQSEAFASTLRGSPATEGVISGAYLHTSWFLTGENRQFEPFGQHGAQFARNKPQRDLVLNGDCPSWGAWEAKARWSWLDLGDVQSGQYNDLTVGLNWYWNDRTRVMLDWIHPVTSSDAVFGAVRADLVGLRLDFNW